MEKEERIETNKEKEEEKENEKEKMKAHLFKMPMINNYLRIFQKQVQKDLKKLLQKKNYQNNWN